jgi:serine/threonine protein kinase
MADPNDPPAQPFRPSRSPTKDEVPAAPAVARNTFEPGSGGPEFSRVEGEEDLHEVQPDLPDVRAELDDAERGGRYQDGPILGAGGLGEVRLRKDRRVGRSVATKIMHEHVETAETRQRFLREARVQGQLEHPAIVPVYDLGVEDGRLFFTMKRVRGQTLARILFGLASGEDEYLKRFSRRRILASYLQVCRAVHYAHVHGVLHRDIKPANVMIGDYGEIYVLDWGLARTLEVRPTASGASAARVRHSLVTADPTRVRSYQPNLTKPGNLLGTLAYMSPEQVRTETLDARADVYSLGVILYEILALRRFREDSSYLRVISQIVDGVVARPSDHVDIDPSLDAICVKATAIDRDERYESALQIAEEIERWLDGARDAESQKRSAAAAVRGAKERLASDDPETAAAALHDLLRAVSLDPDNHEAPKLIVATLEDSPQALPKEVEAEIASRKAERAPVGTLIAIACALSLVPAPAAWALGVRHGATLGVTIGATLLLLMVLLYLRSMYAAHLARLDASDRRLAVQAYHLRQLFPGAVLDDKRDRLSDG